MVVVQCTYNIFAVLAPIGPLRKVQEKAGDYSHDVLRFLMFTADAKQSPEVVEEPDSQEEESSSSSEEEEESGEEKEKEVEDEQKAQASVAPADDAKQPPSDTTSFTLTTEDSG
ncbi:unnamed protein product, partial [Cylicostephanus goldi]